MRAHLGDRTIGSTHASGAWNFGSTPNLPANFMTKLTPKKKKNGKLWRKLFRKVFGYRAFLWLCYIEYQWKFRGETLRKKTSFEVMFERMQTPEYVKYCDGCRYGSHCLGADPLDCGCCKEAG